MAASEPGVFEVALERERVRNALDLATTERLLLALDEAGRDPAVRAVLLHGAGAGFCAGSDVKEMAQASMQQRLDIAARKALLMRALAELDKPVVCAVHGFALGGGFMLAIGCDVVVTAPDAAWRLPEVGLGFFPPWGIEALVRRTGVARARWLVWGADPLTGRDAVRLGLAEVEAATGQVLEVARASAARLARLPAVSVATTKRFFREQLPVAGLDALAREAYRQDFAAGAAESALVDFNPRAG